MARKAPLSGLLIEVAGFRTYPESTPSVLTTQKGTILTAFSYLAPHDSFGVTGPLSTEMNYAYYQIDKTAGFALLDPCDRVSNGHDRRTLTCTKSVGP